MVFLSNLDVAILIRNEHYALFLLCCRCIKPTSSWLSSSTTTTGTAHVHVESGSGHGATGSRNRCLL